MDSSRGWAAPHRVQITFPSTAKSKYPKGFDMALANFGAPRYGGKLMYGPQRRDPLLLNWEACVGGPPPPSLPAHAAVPGLLCRGKLVYVDKDYGRDVTCSPACKYACQAYDVRAAVGAERSSSPQAIQTDGCMHCSSLRQAAPNPGPPPGLLNP